MCTFTKINKESSSEIVVLEGRTAYTETLYTPRPQSTIVYLKKNLEYLCSSGAIGRIT
jgi:hypothetical protein